MATPTVIKGDLKVTGSIEGTLPAATTTTKGVVKQAAALTTATATSENVVTVVNDIITKLTSAGVINSGS